MLSTTIFGGFALLVAAFTNALPVQGTSAGMIAMTTKSQAVGGSYHITDLTISNLYMNKTTKRESNVLNFVVHDATNTSLTSTCDFEWAIGAPYFIETYTPCSGRSFQFRIEDGSFTNVSSFSIEIEHALATETEANGQQIPGGNAFATASVVQQGLSCKSLRGGMDCFQTSAILANVTALDG